MGPLIEAAGLHVDYRRSRTGLVGVDLAVLPGEIIAVLGPNGSGKSTLVRTLAGDLRPTGGTLLVAAGAIGWAPDEAVHVDALDVRANAHLFARANGGPAAVAAVGALLESFALADDAHRPAGELSFGQRRKLMLVQALAHAPSLLLLDEPTVGLDPPANDALGGQVRAIASRGGAVVLAGNDVGAAAALASRIVFLRAGRKVADDAPDALLRAVRGSTRIEIDAPAPHPGVAFPGGVHAVARDGGWTLDADAGTSVLPSVCDAIVSAGARITAIRVHEIDLSDAYRALTGDDWRPGRPEAA